MPTLPSQTPAPARSDFVDQYNRAIQFQQIYAGALPLHAANHMIGGMDPISPNGIGAVDLSDPRLTDARTPLAHRTTHFTAGSDPLSPSDIGACSDTDPRLSNNRFPTAHKSTHAIGGTDVLTPTDIGAANAVHTHIPSAITGLVLSNILDMSHAGTNPALGGQTYYFATAADLSAVITVDNRLFSVAYPFKVIGASIIINNPATFAVGTNNETFAIYNFTDTASVGNIYSGTGVNNHNARTVTLNITGLNLNLVAGKQYSIQWIFGSGFSTAPTSVRQAVVLYVTIPYGSYA